MLLVMEALLEGMMTQKETDRAYLEVEGLVKYFGDDRAVDRISFRISKGKFLTLLGPTRSAFRWTTSSNSPPARKST